jgi:hypothetical protein
MQTLYEVIHYLAEIFEYAVDYGTFMQISNDVMRTYILNRNLHAAIGKQLSATA